MLDRRLRRAGCLQRTLAALACRGGCCQGFVRVAAAFPAWRAATRQWLPEPRNRARFRSPCGSLTAPGAVRNSRADRRSHSDRLRPVDRIPRGSGYPHNRWAISSTSHTAAVHPSTRRRRAMQSRATPVGTFWSLCRASLMSSDSSESPARIYAAIPAVGAALSLCYCFATSGGSVRGSPLAPAFAGSKAGRAGVSWRVGAR